MIICLIINNYPVKQFASELLVGTENIIIDTENTCRNISSNRTETNLTESDLIYIPLRVQCSSVQHYNSFPQTAHSSALILSFNVSKTTRSPVCQGGDPVGLDYSEYLTVATYIRLQRSQATLQATSHCGLCFCGREGGRGGREMGQMWQFTARWRYLGTGEYISWVLTGRRERERETRDHTNIRPSGLAAGYNCGQPCGLRKSRDVEENLAQNFCLYYHLISIPPPPRLRNS